MKKDIKSDNNTQYSRREIIRMAIAGGISASVFGCAQQTSPPVILSNPNHYPVTITPAVNNTNSNSSIVPTGWIPTAAVERKWTDIIVHHSATQRGNAAIFNTAHLARGWDGVGYDFVIGNGTNSNDGQIEVTFRWAEQRTGAHVGGTPNNWANEFGIGICLVGDFNRTVPTEKQLQSLVKLVNFLRQKYNIPTNRIYGHKDTPGARATDCPGNNFPMARFKSMLQSSL